MKIFFDTTSLMTDLASQGASDRHDFYKKVFEITGKWWEQVLQVNDSRSEIAGEISYYAPYYKRELGFNMGGNSISSYDLLIRVFLCPNNGSGLANAGPFVRHPKSQRPITGTVCILPYGDANFKKAKDSVNRAVGTVIHEFGHIIAFISFKTYQDKNIVLDDNINRYKWTGPKVKSVAEKYYNCSNNTGVPLQNKNGKLGGHWSEKFLSDELMTPTTGANPELVSPMTLALCEDTGWYKADYSFTENYSYKKGKGCNLTAGCGKKPICRKGASGFITSDQKGVGYCTGDTNGCPMERKYSNRDCDNGASWKKTLLKFGASYGSNCVVVGGKFRRLSGGYIYSRRQLSVQAQCSKASYTLTFKNFQFNSSGKANGDATVTCTSAEDKTFNLNFRYPSTVKCSEPTAFCAARFGKNNATPKCDDTCQQNGRCQNVGSSASDGRRMEISDFLNAPKIRLAEKNCPTTTKPTTPEPTPTNTSTPDSKPPTSSTSTSGAKWQCWCYSDGIRRTACPSLDEDKDGVGYD